MKTFYTYDIPENRLLVKVFLGIIIFTGIGVIAFGYAVFFSKKAFFLNVILFGFSLLACIACMPIMKKYDRLVKSESIIAHDWGIEYINGDVKRDVKWDSISTVDIIDNSYPLWKMMIHVVSVYNAEPVKFFSFLENADFLHNYIKKNLKKRADDIDLKWQK